MAVFVDLPLELHACISTYLGSDDCRAIASCSRSLRNWRDFAWRVVELRPRSLASLIQTLELLSRALYSNNDLGAMVRTLRIRSLKPRKRDLLPEPEIIARVDILISKILNAAMGLRTFVLDSLRGIMRAKLWRLEDAFVAILSLPLLETLSLASISGRQGHLTRMTSTSLRRAIFFEVGGFDIGLILEGQTRLERLECACLAPQAYKIISHVPGTWLELQELSLRISMPGKLLGIIEEVLHGGGLRNLRTFSIHRADLQPVVWKLVAIFSQHRIPITSLYFFVDYFEQSDLNFSPALLAHVFVSLPYLEVLCVDQPNVSEPYITEIDESDVWPELWDEYLSAFNHARRLHTLIVPCVNFLHSGLSESDVYAALYAKVESLMHACPKLSLVVCTAYRTINEQQYTRAAESSASDLDQGMVVSPSASPGTSGHLRFWIPSEDIDVAVDRHNTYCARRDAGWKSVLVG